MHQLILKQLEYCMVISKNILCNYYDIYVVYNNIGKY